MLKVTANVANAAKKHKENYKPILIARFNRFKQRVITYQNTPTPGRAKQIISEFRVLGLDVTIFDVIEEFIGKNSDFLLDSKPKELLDFSEKYNTEKANSTMPDLACKGIEYVFDYNPFSDEDHAWGAYNLIKSLKITVCPYCNRNYVFMVDATSGRKGVRPELDHFFCRKIHPVLSVSFYNLIPSCHTCNHTKSDEPFDHVKNLHPYLEGIDIGDIIFDFSVNGATTSTVNADDVTIWMNSVSDPALKGKFDANKKVLFLEELYSLHKENAARIIRLSTWYDDSIKSSLKSILNANSDKDIDLMIIGTRFTQEDLLIHPLSKFSHDILMQCRNKVNVQRHKLKIST